MKNSLTNILAGVFLFSAGALTYHFVDVEFNILSKYFNNKSKIESIKKENAIIKKMNQDILASITKDDSKLTTTINQKNFKEISNQIEESTEDLLVKIEEIKELSKISVKQLNKLKKKCTSKSTCNRPESVKKKKPIIKKKKKRICNQYWMCKKNKEVEWESICYRDQVSIKEKVKVKELTKKYRKNSTEVTEDIIITTIEPEIKRKPKAKMCYEKNKWLISQCKNICR